MPWKTYKPRFLDEALNFAQGSFRRNSHPEPLLRRFFSDLILSSGSGMELRQGSELVGLAVLVDKAPSAGGYVSLEVLALRPECATAEIYAKLLDKAKRSLAPELIGFTLDKPATPLLSGTWQKKQGLLPHYKMYDMKRASTAAPKELILSGVEAAGEQEELELYKALTRAFAENEETSIPPFTSWAHDRAKDQHRETFLKREGGRIVAFINIGWKESTGEIRTLGVLPESRGRGLGALLIGTALGRFEELNLFCTVLTVAVKNEAALALYRQHGFEVSSSYEVLSWSRWC